MITKVTIGSTVSSLQIHPLVGADAVWMSVESISGLGSPSTRNEVYDLARRHGQVNRTSHYSGRVIDIVGRLVVNTGDGSDLADSLDDIKKRLSLSQDVKVLFRRRERATDEFVTARVSSPVDVTYKPRDVDVVYYSVQLVAGDPRMYEDALTTGILDPTISETLIGFTTPVAFPLVFGTPPDGALEVTNSGNFATPPVITITGPVTNPVIRNATSSKTITLNVVLASGDTLVVDVAARRVTIAGGSRADVVDAANTQWWEIEPGDTSITMTGSSMVSGETTLSIAWRDARI